MAPSAIDPAPAGLGRPQDVINPPHLYTVKEAHFAGYVPPKPDGYHAARSKGADDVAIIIDNGELTKAMRRTHRGTDNA